MSDLLINQIIESGRVKLVCSRPRKSDSFVKRVATEARENNYYGAYLTTVYHLEDGATVSSNSLDGGDEFEIKII